MKIDYELKDRLSFNDKEYLIDNAGLELVIISFDEKSIKTFNRKIKEKFKILSDPKIRI